MSCIYENPTNEDYSVSPTKSTASFNIVVSPQFSRQTFIPSGSRKNVLEIPSLDNSFTQSKKKSLTQNLGLSHSPPKETTYNENEDGLVQDYTCSENSSETEYNVINNLGFSQPFITSYMATASAMDYLLSNIPTSAYTYDKTKRREKRNTKCNVAVIRENTNSTPTNQLIAKNVAIPNNSVIHLKQNPEFGSTLSENHLQRMLSDNLPNLNVTDCNEGSTVSLDLRTTNFLYEAQQNETNNTNLDLTQFHAKCQIEPYERLPTCQTDPTFLLQKKFKIRKDNSISQLSHSGIKLPQAITSAEPFPRHNIIHDNVYWKPLPRVSLPRISTFKNETSSWTVHKCFSPISSHRNVLHSPLLNEKQTTSVNEITAGSTSTSPGCAAIDINSDTEQLSSETNLTPHWVMRGFRDNHPNVEEYDRLFHKSKFRADRKQFRGAGADDGGTSDEEEKVVQLTLLTSQFLHRPRRNQRSESSISVKRELTWQLQIALACMLLVSILCNFDHGAIPACLNDIATQLGLSFTQQSLLGSLVYVGLIGGTVAAGALLQRVEPKKILLVSLCLLTGSILAFSFFNSLRALYVARLVSGIAQAFPTVYLSVWVDEFAPSGSTARWMSFTQLASILGTVLGYFIGGLLTRLASHPLLSSDSFSLWNDLKNRVNETWHLPFIIQTAFLVPSIIMLQCCKKSDINVTFGSYSATKTSEPDKLKDHYSFRKGEWFPESARLSRSSFEWFSRPPGTKALPDNLRSVTKEEPKRSRKERINGDQLQTTTEVILKSQESYRNEWSLLFTEIKLLLSQPGYVLITLAMSNLYFIVTGVQFWVTQYLVDGLQYDKFTVITSTTFCFLTSPTSGVYIGGLICDMAGGYKKSKKTEAIRLMTIFAGIASLCAFSSAFVVRFIPFVTFIWLCLFSGAAIVPIAIGLVMSSVPPPLRSLSSAISQIAYNLFGWSAGPLLSGERFIYPSAIMDAISSLGYNSPLPLIWGFRFILFSSLTGFLCFLTAYFTI